MDKIDLYKFTDDDLIDRINYIHDAFIEVSSEIDNNESEAKRKLQILKKFIDGEQTKMLTNKANDLCNENDIFEQYSSFILGIHFERGRITSQNYVTNRGAIQSSAENSKGIVYQIFYPQDQD